MRPAVRESRGIWGRNLRGNSGTRGLEHVKKLVLEGELASHNGRVEHRPSAGTNRGAAAFDFKTAGFDSLLLASNPQHPNDLTTTR